jgi:hypothetical protein
VKNDLVRITVLGALVLVAACATRQLPPIPFDLQFKPEDVAWAAKPGGNTLVGFAVLRTVGGKARTCAGLEVDLIPAGAYATERMRIRYGSSESSYVPDASVRDLSTADPAYSQTMRTTLCDGQGNFSFENLASGPWYVITSVTWISDTQFGTVEGGVLMRRVELGGNTTTKVGLGSP